MEWVKQCEQRIRELEEKYLRQREFFEKLKKYKEDIFGGRLKNVTRSLWGDPSISYVAVDSAFKRTVYLHSDVYAIVAVAVCEKGFLNNRGEIRIETRGITEEDEERNSRFLEGLALSLEIELAAEIAPDYRLVILDGSYHTFLTKFNSAFRLALRSNDNNPLRQLLHERFEGVSQCFHDLVVRHPTVAVPKAFRSTEIESFLKTSSNWRSVSLKDLEDINPYVLLEALLDEGEYFELEPEEVETRAWTYPEEYRQSKSLLEGLRKRKVCFMKGIGGRVFKFEYILYLDPWFLYVLTSGGKELLPLKVADEYAKRFLQDALSPVSVWEEYR